jgi:hypothetical protein
MFQEKLPEAQEERPLTFKDYVTRQEEIILSPENRAAAQDFYQNQPDWSEHELTRNELAEYFITSGQAKKFEIKYRPQIRKAA